MSSSLARISQEKEIVEESFQERTEDLEAEVARLQELNAQLTTSLESERRAAIAAEERAAVNDFLVFFFSAHLLGPKSMPIA
eukprot:m.136992 g.136992  ORF g.136992 m.136992 type:complete len:82 (+) comp16985_c0_seq5:441-686(+)